MRLIQEVVSLENMWIELGRTLDSVDADFTGLNGEEYYNNEGMSYMDSAIKYADEIECEQERIDYVLEKCKEYSSNYYNGFEYSVIDMGNDKWLVTIATVDCN